MATNSTLNIPSIPAHNHLLENHHYLSGHRCLQRSSPLLKQRQHHVSLGLRRSASLEQSSTDTNLNCSQKSDQQNSSNLSLAVSTLSTSLNCLCVRIRSHQLLSEHNENIAQSANEHEFNWWNTIDHLRPLLENIILSQKFTNQFKESCEKEDSNLAEFAKCKRNGRRNAVCTAIDKLCYNEQMILFTKISEEVQVEYNLISSGFTP